MRLEHAGILTAGYYNDVEAGRPVFIDGESLSDIVKQLLADNGLDSEFCYGPPSSEGASSVENPLIGRRVKLVLEISEVGRGKEKNDRTF